MSRSVTITYELNPPQDTPAQELSATKTHELAISAENGSLKTYYESVREAIAKGKDVIGEELTAWRDAVGNKEHFKEAKVVNKETADDEEEEDEDEDGGE